jgi:protein TonB
LYASRKTDAQPAESPRQPSPEPLPFPQPVASEELFQALLVSGRPAGRSGVSFWTSLVVHVALIAAAILIPALWPHALPGLATDAVAVFLYDPPPPPPLPLPPGNPLIPQRSDLQRKVKAKQDPVETSEPSDVVRLELPRDFTPPDLSEEQWGSDTGNLFGVPEGMEGGDPAGQIGGVPGGVVGGVVGGRLGGTSVVMDYDRPPRLIHQTRPVYPEAAFIKKIEGIVLLEILIGIDGRVHEARVLQSVPLLDAAALATVKQWRFESARKHGRPVATLARAPIQFTIY